jgi:hypothetical protein
MHSTSEKDSDSKKILRAVLKIAPSPPLDVGCWMPGVFGVFGIFLVSSLTNEYRRLELFGTVWGEAAKTLH